MTKFIIRNDDIAFDTNIDEIKKFCEICDKYSYRIIQSITPLGVGGHYARASMTNELIKLRSPKRFEENKQVLEFLRKRNDLIAVHGLWHTHAPTDVEIKKGKEILQELGFNPTYFVPPFNEGVYQSEVEGLIVSQLDFKKGDLLETFLNNGEPISPIMYLHSWRFRTGKYGCSFEKLDKCLARLSDPIRLWYNDWVRENARGKVLDIGKSRYWDYGFPTLDNNPRLRPTYLGSVEKIDFPNENFDTVLCNGMYEFISDPQAMIDEVLRITKKGGIAIFGFVGKDYKPYRSDWKYYSGKESFPLHTRVDFGEHYHYLICKK